MRAGRPREPWRTLAAQARLLLPPRPAETDRVHAARVAVGLSVPGIALLVAGRPDLIPYAVFGSFTGMYGRAEPPRQRLRQQAQAGTILVAGVSIGLLLATLHARPWALVAIGAACAAVGSVVTDRLGLKPAGPFFGIFALGTMATIPAGRVSPGLAVAICAGTALFSVVVTAAAALWSRSRGARTPAPPPPGDAPRPLGLLIHAARYAIAIAVAGSAGLALGIDHANWAMVSAAVPLAAIDKSNHLDPAIRDVVHRGAHRVAGTLTGLALTALLLLPQPNDAVLAVLVIVLLFPTELYMLRHYGVALGFFTPLIMLMTQIANPEAPLALVTDRVVDTLIGVAAGIAVAVVIRGPRQVAHGTAIDR
ncbi:FUSC family protein [Pseudonocardia sp. C8]|uniref:FUSC family protein n=1 Tax=Pseudonocardia sp. C8 TaxID=2762759 RepID=UPI00351C2DE8